MKRITVLAITLLLLLVLPISAAITRKAKPDSISEQNELVVTAARFGSGTKVADVTKRVAELLSTGPKEFFANANFLQVDPWPYRTKALAILYRYQGKDHLFVVQGGDKVTYEMLVKNGQR
jgi:hypothetical protein